MIFTFLIITNFITDRYLNNFQEHLLGRRQANLCFHFAGSGENLPDIAKSRDASMGRKQNSFLFRTASCHFSVEVFPQITNNLSAGGHCQRDIKEAPLYECQRISA